MSLVRAVVEKNLKTVVQNKTYYMELTLDYIKGIVDGIVNYTTEFTQEIDLSDKEFIYEVSERGNHGYKVKMKWLRGYVPAKYSDEMDRPDYDNQEIYFSSTVKIDKIIKEILSQLESIEAVEIVELFESDLQDNSDDMQELRREGA